MISNRFLVLISVFLALCACKTQHVVPLVLKDSVSITYKQGKEQPTPLGTQVPQNISPPLSKKCSLVGTYSLGSSTQSSSSTFAHFPDFVEEGTAASSLEADRQRDIRIRVDTVFVERWHTTEVQAERLKGGEAKPAKPVKPAKLVFYKNCTIGFWILLLLLIGRIAFRIMKAIYLRR